MDDPFAEMFMAEQDAMYYGDMRPKRFGGTEETEITEKDLRYDPDFIRNSKIVYQVMQGEQFSGDDDEAHEYGLNIMSSASWNFGNPLAGEVAGVEIRPGFARQVAELMASGSMRYAKAWVYLFDQYERVPNFTASATYRAIRDFLTDPGIYTGVGVAGTIAKKAGMKGIVASIRKLATEQPMKAAAGAGAGAMAVPETGQIAIEEQAGFEEPLSERAAQVGTQAAVGAVAGPALVKGGELAVKGVKKAAEYVKGETNGVD